MRKMKTDGTSLLTTTWSMTKKSRRILIGLAEGHSIEQMLAADQEMKYGDVAQAAKEALYDTKKRFEQTWLKKAQEKNPRAYESWSLDEDQLLSAMALGHAGLEEMMDELGRSQSAVWTRLKKLRLPFPPGRDEVYTQYGPDDGTDF